MNAAEWLASRGLADLLVWWPQGKPVPQIDYKSEQVVPTLINLMKAFAASETAAKEAAEEQVKELRLSRDGISRALSNRNEYIIGLHKQLAAAEAERGRAVRLIPELCAAWKVFHDALPDGEYKGLGEVRIIINILAKPSVSPVPVPATQTCPTCGHDVRCIHGIDFRDKCETCEAIESYYEAGPAPKGEKS